MNYSVDTIHWRVLGIEPGADEKTVKRAYAQRLKVVRPDEDAKKFQELRAAYEYALQHVGRTTEKIAAITQHQPPAQQAHAKVQAYSPERVNERAGAQYTFRMPTSITDAPHLPSPHPATVARDAWQTFLDACKNLAAPHERQQPPDEAVHQAKRLLAAAIRQPDLESLAAREEFRQTAIRHCAHESAQPLIRIACLEVLRWDEERRLINYRAGPEAYAAINLALADKQYNFLATEAVHCAATKELLDTTSQGKIRWRKLYKRDFAANMRDCIMRIRSSMPEVERHRIGIATTNTWLDAAARPWPSFFGFAWALFLGLGIAVVTAGLIKDNVSSVPASAIGDAGLFLICILLFFLPAVVISIYPRYVHRPAYTSLRRMRSDRRIHLVWWALHVVLSTLAFALHAFPSFGETYLALVAVLLIGDLLLKERMNPGYLMFLLMTAFLLGQPLYTALTPYMGEAAIFTTGLVSGLFVSPRMITMNIYGQDWYRARVRLVLLAIGALVAGLEYTGAAQAPLVFSIAGWWWILAAAPAADLFCVSLAGKNGQLGELIWLFMIALLLYFPQSIDIDSPVAGMLRLQISVAAALVVGMLQSGASYLMRKKKK